MGSNVQQFNLNLRRYAKKLNVEIPRFITAIALNFHLSVALRTPVDTGRARASWILNPVSPDLSWTAPKKETQSLGKLNVGANARVYWVTNNLPYIEKLEFGGYGNGPKTVAGYSKQAPRGMVRLALLEVESKLEQYFPDI